MIDHNRNLLLPASFIVAGYLLFGTIRFDNGNNTDFYARLMDAGHFPLLAALTLLLISSGVSAVRAAAALGASAIAVELLQPYFGRAESLTDLKNGLLGILFACLASYFSSASTGRRALVALSGLLCFAALLIPAYREWDAIRWRAAHFPVLATFEDAAELRLWRALEAGTDPAVVDAPQLQGIKGMRVQGAPGKRFGALYFAGDMNWSNYDMFIVEIYSEKEGVTLGMRIDDSHDCTEYNDRYNEHFALRPGWNRIEVPLRAVENQPKNRALDLKEVRRILFFALESAANELIFRQMKLVSKPELRTKHQLTVFQY